MSNDVMEDRATVEECRFALCDLPFFSGLTEDDLRGLADLARVREYGAGGIVFYEDDEADALYFLCSGAIEVFKSDQTGKKLPLILLRDHGLLGEMGLLTGAPRSATARALNPSRVLYFKTIDFYQALHDGLLPAFHLVLAFSRILSQRLNSMDEKIFQIFTELASEEESVEIVRLKRKLISMWSM